MRGVQPSGSLPITHQAPPRATGLPPILISMAQLQRTLSIGKTKAFAIVAEGAVETVTLGRRRMAVLRSVEAYVEYLREQQRTA